MGLMVPGKRYRLVYRSDTQRVDHELILDYLALGSGIDEHNYLMNARPLAGTQAVPKRWVKSIIEVPQTTPLCIDRIARLTDPLR